MTIVRRAILPVPLFIAWAFALALAIGMSFGVHSDTESQRVVAHHARCRFLAVDGDTTRATLRLACGTRTAMTATPAALRAIVARPGTPLICDIRQSGTADCGTSPALR